MSEPAFTAQGSAGLYWLDGAGTTAGFWAGGGAPGDTPTLTQTWAVASGTYLFNGADPGDADVYAASLAAYLAQFPAGGVPRWLWIANPAAPMLEWLATPLFAAAAASGGGWTVRRRADFDFDEYTLVVRGGGAVAPADGGAAGWGFTVADPTGSVAASLLTPAAAMDARAASTVLSLGTATAGCWRFALDAAATGGQGPDAFARLGCGIQYFMPDPDDGAVLPIPFSVLRQPTSTALSFFATLDPLRPFDTGRSQLGFFSWSGTGTAPALHTGFATARGYGVDLTPQLAGGGGAPAARLVFAFAPSDPGSGTDPAVPGSYYLAPEGGFAVTVLDPGVVTTRAAVVLGVADLNRLLCGMSGMEYLGLPTAGAAGLVFVAGQPAYAGLEAGATGADALTAVGTTSWVYAQAPSGSTIRYYAQPEDAPLFGLPAADPPPVSGGDDGSGGSGGSGDDDSIGFLDFLEFAAADLPPPNGTRAFPMAPYRDLDASLLDVARTLEQRALAPCRRAMLAAIATASGDNAGTGGPGDGGANPPVSGEAVGPAHADDAPAPAVPVSSLPGPDEEIPSGGTPSGATTPYADGEAAQVGVTPQGIAVGVAADDETWAWVGIGQTQPGPVTQPDLRFTVCEGDFRQAMLTNNLFLVLGNATEFGKYGSVAYQLTSYAVDVIATSPAAAEWPAELIPAVRTYFSGQGWKSYPTQTAFTAALLAAYATMTADQQLVFRRAAGELTPVVQDWTFLLSPDTWTNLDRQGQTNAYLVFKFVLGRSLAELAHDLSTWAWPAAASPDGEPATAQSAILGIIDAAVPGGDPAAAAPAYRNFARVVTDPNWTGVLALSAEVPLDALPGPLQALAAGIDPSAFYAHHLGMSATPFQVQDGELQFNRSSLFGLIDYENPEDQYFSSDIAFAFRVSQLTVGFQNSVITTFASRVQLLVNRLFGSETRLFPADHGNNVVLVGAYQRQRAGDGTEHDSYVFSMPGAYQFQLAQPVLRSMELLSTQMLTSSAADPQGGSDQVQATFQMAGNLRFAEPPDFDPFCWGPAVAEEGTETDGWLRFGNLAVTMTFSLGDPGGTTVFTLRDGDLSFDFANSQARAGSLASRFPVRLTGLVSTPDPALSDAADDGAPPVTPESMGYVSVSSPLEQSVMGRPWYGLAYTIDLGTLGALAGSAGISLQVLAGWTPTAVDAPPAVYLGVRLPGTRDVFGSSLPLQGILRLGFRSIEWLVDGEGETRSYTLRLRDFAIRFLGLSFPPGHNDVYLFGNPDQGSSSKVGWYAAYAAEDDTKKQGAPPSRRQVQAARAAVRALPPPEDP